MDPFEEAASAFFLCLYWSFDSASSWNFGADVLDQHIGSTPKSENIALKLSPYRYGQTGFASASPGFFSQGLPNAWTLYMLAVQQHETVGSQKAAPGVPFSASRVVVTGDFN